ncbi:LOW QUALITY PROTEIN: coagulation factor XII [Rhinatrema bivittatum]|uniref:LOW QUALITY PROTEIN: coagulation factor XII n=1 Tax=Rhinatrema bivittatum TaxID=194408 RepID=UPI001127DB86|nr:LOW QUALITY PROTEIN: coagulation factor XII [Rhinatrema bivittatum]
MELLLLALNVFLCCTSHLGHSHKAEKASASVVTESGQLCHFPFQYNRKLYSSCTNKGRPGGRRWCALTQNYDQDQLWSYCKEQIKVKDHCEKKACRNGGTCVNTLKNYECICETRYTGRNCHKEKCFDSQLLQYFSEGEHWLRFRPPTLEQCQCSERGTACHPVPATECARNPCLNGGSCAEWKKTSVCAVQRNTQGSSVTQISGRSATRRMVPSTGALQTRPSLGWTASPGPQALYSKSLPCTTRTSNSLGLGRHAYCRNPDNDPRPWCYILREHHLSWEYCRIPPCNGTQDSGRVQSTGKPEELNEEGRKPEDAKDGSSMPPEQCGKRYRKSASLTPRIVGGLVALPASHPYIAAIYMGKKFCGGSLIASCWVVTGCSLLANTGQTSPRLASCWGQSSFNRSSPESAEFAVDRYLLHEQFSALTFRHDIALIRLKATENEQCAEFSRFIVPVCLPNPSEAVSPGSPCEVAGWGFQYEGAGVHSVYLQEALVPILSQEQCMSPELHGSRLSEGMLCAGYLQGAIDACQGDSGGPLVCEDAGKVVLHGVVSWGTGCAQENKPGVYINVTSYIDWIKGKMS